MNENELIWINMNSYTFMWIKMISFQIVWFISNLFDDDYIIVSLKVVCSNSFKFTVQFFQKGFQRFKKGFTSEAL
jgi:hypothetical protein